MQVLPHLYSLVCSYCAEKASLVLKTTGDTCFSGGKRSKGENTRFRPHWSWFHVLSWPLIMSHWRMYLSLTQGLLSASVEWQRLFLGVFVRAAMWPIHKKCLAKGHILQHLGTIRDLWEGIFPINPQMSFPKHQDSSYIPADFSLSHQPFSRSCRSSSKEKGFSIAVTKTHEEQAGSKINEWKNATSL